MSFLAYLLESGYSGQQTSRSPSQTGTSSGPKSLYPAGTGSQKAIRPPGTRCRAAASTKARTSSFRPKLSHWAPKEEVTEVPAVPEL